MDAACCGRPSFRLALAINNYAYPEDRQGSDADWLDGYIQVDGGSVSTVRAKFEIAWRTEEIAGFQREVSALLSGEAETAVLEHLEEMVSVAFEARGASIRLTGYVTDAAGLKINFDEIETGRDELEQFNAQLSALVEEYPVRDPELRRRMLSRADS